MPRWPSTDLTTSDLGVAPGGGAPGVGDEPDPGLPAGAGGVLLPMARAAIASELGLHLPSPEPPAWVHRPGACFVTLTTAGALHGCIGSLSPRRSLRDDVEGNALAAAFGDRRFPALTRAELDDTTVEVSVLSATTPLPVTDEADALARLRPGVDGVVLEYAGRRATFLPQVWATVPEPRAFLAHLRVKAGLPPTFWSHEVRLSRYTVAAFREGDEER